MTDIEYLKHLRIPTKVNPLIILMSSCLTGLNCGYDESSYGEHPSILKLLNYETIKVVKFCPEEYSFGTPREVCDIHGGSGIDVLNGNAKVITETGKDWTEGMINASERMLDLAKSENVDIAVMMDISAACGSQVIYKGNRHSENKSYQVGAGVSAAQLIRNGFKVISQRDFASLEVIYSRVDGTHQIDLTKKDHHENDWYKSYFQV